MVFSGNLVVVVRLVDDATGSKKPGIKEDEDGLGVSN